MTEGDTEGDDLPENEEEDHPLEGEKGDHSQEGGEHSPSEGEGERGGASREAGYLWRWLRDESPNFSLPSISFDPETIRLPNVEPVFRQALSDVAQSAREGKPKAGAREIDELDPTERADLDDRIQDTGLKKLYAKWLLGMLSLQMLIADIAFYIFAAVGEHWKLSTSVIDVWLAATVVQVIAVVTIIVHYLFPRRDDGKQ